MIAIEAMRAQSVAKALDLLPIASDRRGVQRNDFRRLFGGKKLLFELLALSAQFREPALDLMLLGKSLRVGIQQPLEFPLGARKLPLQPVLACDQARRKALALRVVGFDIRGDQRRVAQVLRQPAEHCLFDVSEDVCVPVLAGAGLLHPSALNTGDALSLVLHRHSAAAAPAPQQTGKEVARTPLLMRRRPATLASDRDRLFIGILVDDTQALGIGVLPLGRRVDPRDATSRIRVLDHPDLVPDDTARIDLIADNAVVTRQRAVDRRSRPILTARRRHATRVQRGSNLSRCLSIDIGCVDLPHDGGLVVVDLELAGLARNRSISIGPSAGVAAVAHDARQTTPHLVSKILEIQGADKAADADLNLIRLSVMDGAQLHPEEVEALPDACQILLVAREAVQRLDEDDIEGVVARGVEHPHEAIAPENRCARPGAVIEDRDNLEAVPGCVGAAKRELVIDRALVLQFR